MGRVAAALLAAGALAATAVAGVPAPARAAAPRLVLSNERAVPIDWFQGLTHSAAGSRFFIGVVVGATRTDAALRVRARRADVIAPDITARFGFDHVGDPTWDRREGGRLLLPMECFTPGAPNGGNTCGLGMFGVADPVTLVWRYGVLLDRRDIAKAMWAEVSPDGRLLWTSSGDDLLAYRTADVSAAAAAGGVPIRPVRRLRGAVPRSGVTGGAFRGGRLLLAGQAPGGGPLQVWSVDVDGVDAGVAPPVLEAQLRVTAEPEGIDVLATPDGLLHWLLSPVVAGRTPTFGTGHSELVSFVPRAGARLRVAAARASRSAANVFVTLRVGGRPRPVARARVRAAGVTALTGADGRAVLRGVGPAAATVVARKLQLRPGRATIPAALPPRLTG